MYTEYAQFTAPNATTEARIEAMLAKLSLEEKIDLLGGVIGSPDGNTVGVAHAGVPALRMADGPVGIHWWCDSSTAYPACIGLAASWNRELGYEAGEAIGRDGRARGVHILLAPGVNIYRSPLCGRNFEYLGEDPYLASEMVVGTIRGCQDQGMATTVKHFACNYQEYDRHGISTDADERTLREVYLPAFEAAVREGGSACVMTAYNLINGQHASEHEHLIMDILKGEWGFDGLVMSDWVSTYCEVGAANNGLDLEMPNARYLNRDKLLPAIANGLVTEATIDGKVRRLLRLMVCFGWLDHEQKDPSIPLVDPQTHAVALEIARQGSVLLKNDGLLPLDRHRVKRLAVVGWHAATPVICGGGSAYTPPNHLVSILDGIQALAGDGMVVEHAVGVNPCRHERCFAESVFSSPTGERGLRSDWRIGRHASGEANLTRLDAQVDFQWHGLPPLDGFPPDDWWVEWTGELVAETGGEHVFYLGINEAAEYELSVGGSVLIETATANSGLIKQATMTLEAGRRYPVRLVYRAFRNWNAVRLGYEPTAAIKAEFAAAVALAGEADAVVLCTGFTKETESEGFDRTFGLPPDQEKLVRAVAAANPATALVLHAGGNVDMGGWIDDLQGVLQVWYPGQEGGRAIAELLFGEVSPSGKLPATFEAKLEDRSSFDSYHDADGDQRVLLKDGIFGGYRHVDRHGIAPRFPFGFGLSYTTFAYENLSLSATRIGPEDQVEVSFDIVNTGDRAGAEVAQLYVRDVESSLPRPVKELKGFARVNLEPGQRWRVEILLDERAFRFWHSDLGGWVVEPGRFEILVGASSQDLRLQADIEVE